MTGGPEVDHGDGAYEPEASEPGGYGQGGLERGGFQPDRVEPDGFEQEVWVPEPPQTGDPAVDDALARLVAAAGRSLEEQVPVYDAVHRTLQDRLADLEG